MRPAATKWIKVVRRFSSEKSSFVNGKHSLIDQLRSNPLLTKIDPLDALTKNTPGFHDLVRDYDAKHFIFGTLSDSIMPWEVFITRPPHDEANKTILWAVLHLNEPYKWPQLVNIAGTLHGGAIATIIDGAAGILFATAGHKGMTANLSTNFRHPIPLPSTILCKAFIKNIEGRKVYITVSITSGDEQFGYLDEHEEIVEYVRGDTLFIDFKEC